MMYWISQSGWDYLREEYDPEWTLFQSDDRMLQSPAWGPKGFSLAFYSTGDGGDPGEVVIGDQATDIIYPLVGLSARDKPEWAGYYPVLDWSPDGAWIAYEDAGSIRIVRVHGSGESEPIVEGYAPSWRPR
jgi:hypothetical protein